MKSDLVVAVAVALFTVAFAYPKPAEVVSRDEDSSEKDGETEFVREPVQRNPVGFGIGFPHHGLSEPSQQRHFLGDPFSNDIGKPSSRDGYSSRKDDNDMQAEFMTEVEEFMTVFHKRFKTPLADNSDGLDDDGGVNNSTTSTTRVINGHTFTVNESRYSSGDGDVVYKISMTNVIPYEVPENSGIPEELSNSDVPDTENEVTSKLKLEEDENEEDENEKDENEEYEYEEDENEEDENEVDENEVDENEEDENLETNEIPNLKV